MRVSPLRPLAIFVVTSCLVGVAALGGTVVGAQGDPTVAPSTTISADGRTVTDGVRTLTTSQATDLDPSGQSVGLAGSGYDADKGVYAALCVIPPRNGIPSPCGGGIDMEGSAGSSQWFSSNPPPHGVGLAQPYGPGGSFSTQFHIQAEIAPGIDCRQVRCALVTRSDHTRTADRSQDLMIPVSFRSEPVGQTPPAPGGGPNPPPQEPDPATPSPTTEPTVEVPTTATPPAPPSSAPEATLSDDGTEATDGTRTLTVSEVTDLDPEEATISVTGDAYDDSAGIYVALCAVTDDPTAAPGPCTAGGDTSAWISSNPPEHGADLATPFDDGGTFEAEITVGAVIDGETDCREQTCAVVTRFDDQRSDDRAGDLAVPVTFAQQSSASTTTTTEPVEDDEEEDRQAETVAASSDDSGGGSALLVIVIVGGVALAAAGALVLRSRRSAGTPTEPLTS